MNENDERSSPELTICGRCGTACDAIDNFCRECGLSLQERRLPSVRESRLPMVWRPAVQRAAVRGAIYVAAVKIGEMAARRLVRRALGRGAAVDRLPAGRGSPALPQAASVEEEQVLSETFLLRRTRVRR